MGPQSGLTTTALTFISKMTLRSRSRSISCSVAVDAVLAVWYDREEPTVDVVRQEDMMLLPVATATGRPPLAHELRVDDAGPSTVRTAADGDNVGGRALATVVTGNAVRGVGCGRVHRHTKQLEETITHAMRTSINRTGRYMTTLHNKKRRSEVPGQWR
jgi:hypothetical protein